MATTPRQANFPPAIVAVEYAGQHRTHNLGPTGTFVVGRDRACDLTLSDPAVSRRHVTLFAHAGCLRLVAFPRAQPIFVNGKPVSESFLADRDIVRLGDTTLYVHYPALEGDETRDPKGLRTSARPRTTGPKEVGRAVLSLRDRHGAIFGRLQRAELDEELGQLLGVSAVRARHLLDDLVDQRELRWVGRGTKRYLAVAEAVAGDGERAGPRRNRRRKRG
jgi:pSer/pThr/pTyr-binding forkhead associated (FHA) protein